MLETSKGEKEKIQAVMDDLKERRVTKQPLEYPSAGSTFKRPEGYFAGKLSRAFIRNEIAEISFRQIYFHNKTSIGDNYANLYFHSVSSPSAGRCACPPADKRRGPSPCDDGPRRKPPADRQELPRQSRLLHFLNRKIRRRRKIRSHRWKLRSDS